MSKSAVPQKHWFHVKHYRNSNFDSEKRNIMNFYSGDYDIIVAGAGHAGVEAALASRTNGQKNTVSLPEP